MAWACIATNGPVGLVFINCMIADRNSKMSEVYRALLSTQIQSNAAKPIGLIETNPQKQLK